MGVQQKKMFFPLWFNLHLFFKNQDASTKCTILKQWCGEIKLFEVMKTVLLLISCLIFHSNTVRAARLNDEGKILFII